MGSPPAGDIFNLAFLGCGLATRLHSKTLARFRRQVRCYYASRQPDTAMAYNPRYGGAGFFDSYEAALTDGRIDIALVATPPASHLQLTLAALRAGKHVIVDKPPFLRAGDFISSSRLDPSHGVECSSPRTTSTNHSQSRCATSSARIGSARSLFCRSAPSRIADARLAGRCPRRRRRGAVRRRNPLDQLHREPRAADPKRAGVSAGSAPRR